MDHEEGVGGSDAALQVREAQPVVSQAENLDETSTSMRGGSNVDHSQSNVNDQSTQTGQGSSLGEAPICAYFLTIAEISLA
jgi:hypothetical protein